MENSKIEWCDHTFNPWIGCQKVSPGCDNCYAEAMMDKRLGKVEWGPHGERKRTSKAYWNQPIRWASRRPLFGRPRVFCASLSDWLDNKVPQQWRRDLAILIHATPELDWLLLTKRIENFKRLSPWPLGRAKDELGLIPLPSNVWLGITCEDQERYDQRWPILAEIPAAVRFVSYEPALGPLSIIATEPVRFKYNGVDPDWIICGGESGRGAREMNPEWARSLKWECEQVGVAFFMKQMTGKKPIPDDLMVREFPTVRWKEAA